MSQPPQDPQGYPWGPPEASGASPQGAHPASQPPARPEPQHGDPYGGGQYSGQWSQQGAQQSAVQAPYTGIPHGSGPVQHQGYGAPVRHGGVPTSTIVLLVVSGVSFFSGFLTVASLAPLVLSIVAMVRASRDPAGARHLTKIGWVVYAVVAVLSIVAIVVAIALLLSARTGSATDSGYSALAGLGALAGVPA